MEGEGKARSFASLCETGTSLPQRKLNLEKVRNLPKDTQPVHRAESGSHTGPLSSKQVKFQEEGSLHSVNKDPGRASCGLGSGAIRLAEHLPKQETKQSLSQWGTHPLST